MSGYEEESVVWIIQFEREKAHTANIQSSATLLCASEGEPIKGPPGPCSVLSQC